MSELRSLSEPSTGDLNVLIDGYPGVTLGLTTAENIRKRMKASQKPYPQELPTNYLLQAIDQGIYES